MNHSECLLPPPVHATAALVNKCAYKIVADAVLVCLTLSATQAGLAIVVLLASMGAQFYSRAFFEVSLDVQDSLQLCSLIGMVIIGQLFHDPEMHDTIEGFSGGLSVALFALMGTSVVAVLLMTLVQITQVEKRNLALRYLKLLSKIYEAHHTASGAVSRHWYQGKVNCAVYVKEGALSHSYFCV
jgi:hypothetical protein